LAELSNSRSESDETASDGGRLAEDFVTSSIFAEGMYRCEQAGRGNAGRAV
jgi:hypothetical protein